MTDERFAPTPSDPSELDLVALRAPGLHEVDTADWTVTAERLAADLDGEVVASQDLEATLRRRRSEDGAAARALLERRAQADPSSRIRVVIDIEGLEATARGLARAERVLVGTEANMIETVGQRVSGGGLAVHPESIRSAAKELLTARRELVEIEAERDQLNEFVARADETTTDEGPSEPGERDVERDVERGQGRLDRATKRRVIGVLLMSVGIAVVLGALLAVVVGPLAGFVLILPVVAGWWAYSTAQVRISDSDDKDVASNNLALIAARTDAMFGNVAAEENGASGIPASAGAQLRLIETRLELTRERERGAAAIWVELAGHDADPHDVDRVLRERDPQYFAAIDMVRQTSQARAAAAHARRMRARWRLAWSLLDGDPPAPADAEEAVRELAASGVRSLQINTRVGTDADRAIARRVLDEQFGLEGGGPLILTGLADDLSDELIDELADLSNSTSIVLLSGSSG